MYARVRSMSRSCILEYDIGVCIHPRLTACIETWSEDADLGLLRTHWIIGPPFVDPKSLAIMNNTKGVGGCQTFLTNFVSKTLPPIDIVLSKCFLLDCPILGFSQFLVADGLVNFDG